MNQMAGQNTEAYEFSIAGRVQGVGFRPFVYRLAHDNALTGFVYNRHDGVLVYIEGKGYACENFANSLRKDAPAGSVIKKIERKSVELKGLSSFNILPSENHNVPVTEISPDIAVCNDCLRELQSEDRRKNYPFINCTNCGPRFTIMEDFPYDRINTTMNAFGMCDKCSSEYHNPLDRRFHAQPVSCHDCGPVYSYLLDGNTYPGIQSISEKAAEQINKGEIIAIKGLGGYNLACDAHNEEAIACLRSFKIREKKPFAVMFRSAEDLKKYAFLSDEEENLLNSWRRPVVIVRKLKKRLPAAITSGLSSIGVFLPYLPLHYIIFRNINTDALVLTSGNESDTPIIHTEDAALNVFKDIRGGIMLNNRRIARRADDSVTGIIGGSVCLIRRARGYAPAPVDLSFSADGILATGAELSNCFCIGKANQGILSQHIGDLKNAATYEFYVENIQEFSRIFRFRPERIACDLHPDYLSTQYAAKTGLPLFKIQHHHAHIAAVMAEYGLNEKVIGISYDGTGLGTDGNIWGSEAMIADLKSFSKTSSFEFVPLPGGDHVTREPWRSTLAYLYTTFGENWNKFDIPFFRRIDSEKARLLIGAMEKKINSPPGCSAGRLFDAVSALMGLCTESNYHAEAPMRLEDAADGISSETYSFTAGETISFKKMFSEIIRDISANLSVAEISTKFHNTVAEAAFKQVCHASVLSGIKKTVISGGSFQNKYLTEKLIHLLRQEEFEVFYPREVPCNDGGIALGQLAVAANIKVR